MPQKKTSKSQQRAMRRSQIIMGVIAIIVIASMVISAVMSSF